MVYEKLTKVGWKRLFGNFFKLTHIRNNLSQLYLKCFFKGTFMKWISWEATKRNTELIGKNGFSLDMNQSSILFKKENIKVE